MCVSDFGLRRQHTPPRPLARMSSWEIELPEYVDKEELREAIQSLL